MGGKMLIPRLHEFFIELCAIPTNDLSEEEWALLQVHLAYCGSCLDEFREHQQRVQDQSPSVDGIWHSQEIDGQ
jgi:hypothetical protein